MEAEQGNNFSLEHINLAELERRAGVSRAKLRKLKRSGFQLVPHSWNNFSEGCDLIASVPDYLRNCGCYPQAVLAGKISQARATWAFCREHEIRLVGSALGE